MTLEMNKYKKKLKTQERNVVLTSFQAYAIMFGSQHGKVNHIHQKTSRNYFKNITKKPQKLFSFFFFLTEVLHQLLSAHCSGHLNKILSRKPLSSSIFE